MKKLSLLLGICSLLTFSSYGQQLLDEDFSAGSLPAGWTQTSVSNDFWFFGGSIDQGTTSLTIGDASGNSGQYARIDFSNDPDTTSLVTPRIGGVSGLTNPRLTFQYFSQSNNATHVPLNRMIVDYWNGASWVNITVIDSLTTLGWTKYELNISTFVFSSDTVQFRFSAQEGGAAVGGTGNLTYDQDLALDEVVVEQTPSCFEPTALVVSNVTSSSADLSWTEPSTATEWEVEYDTAGFAPGTGRNVITVNTTPALSITGLMSQTDYSYYVRSVCAPMDSSTWAGPASFTTLCTPFTAPYFNNFETDNLNEAPQCWDQFNSYNPASAFAEVRAFTGTAAPFSGSQALYIYNWFGYAQGSDSLAAISPQFSDLTAGDKQIRFQANSDDPVSQLIVGTMASQSQAAVFNPIDTITFNTPDTYQQVIVQLNAANGYNGTDQFIGLRHNLGGTFDYIRIDEFNYEAIPSCPGVSNLNAISSSSTTADLSWTDNASASEWVVEYDTAGYTVGTARFSVVANTNPNTVLTGLTPNTDYEYYVRAVCAPMDSSTYSVTGSFTTLCAGFTAPYSTDFESDALDVPPTCWSDYETFPNGFVEVENFTGTAAPFGGSQALYIYSSSGFTQGSDTLRAISPQFPGLTASDKQIRFQGNSDDPTTQLIVGTVASLLPSATFNPIDTITFVAADTYQQVIVQFNAANGYNGTDEFIVLQHDLNNTFDYIRIDDFNYEVIPSCPIPSALTLDSAKATTASLSWTENGSATEWFVEYDTAGFTAGAGRFSATVNTNPNFTITGLTASTQYEFNVRAVCAPMDSSARSLSATFATTFVPAQGVNCTTGNPSVIFSEEFDNNNAGWTGAVSTTNSNNSWEIPGTPSSGGTGPNSAFSGSNFMSFESSGGATGAATVSPAIDLTAGVADAELSFWIHAFGSDMGDLNVGIGNSATGPFTTIFTQFGQLQTSGVDAWQNVGVNLSAYLGQTIYLEFDISNVTGYRSDMAIDLVEVTTCLSCAIPTANTTANISSTDATFSWVENGTATEWEVEYDTAGFALGTGRNVVQVLTDTFLNVTGLSPQTSYDWYVRAVCAPADSSGWTAISSFTTPCPTFTVFPSVENFDALSPNNAGIFSCITTDNLTGCWTNDGSNPNNWTARSSATGSTGTGPSFDHTSGTGNYVFLETSGCANISNMLSPIYDVSSLTTPRIKFWYHMLGTNMGTLSLFASTNNGTTWTSIWTLSGNQGNNWIEAIVDLSAYAGSTNLSFRFEGNTNAHPSDMGIDDITIEETPNCLNPIAQSVSNITTTNATLSWVEQGSATEWQIEYGPAGYTLGTGIDSIVNVDTFKTVTGLMSSTSYDWYVRSICAPMDTSAWSTVSNFTTAFQCPAGAICATSTSGDISSDLAFQSLPGTSACPATVSVTIPAGNRIDSISTFYDMTADAGNNAWQSEQRSWLYSPATMSGEPTITNGPGLNTAGTASYSRNGLSFANTATGTVNIEMHAGRTFGGTGCGTTFNKVDDGTWTVIAYYSAVPACIEPNAQSVSAITGNSATLSWVEQGTATEWQIEYGPTGYTLGTGIDSIVNVDTFKTVTGLMSSTSYDWYVRSICAPADTSGWSTVSNFTTAFQCPAGAVCATSTSGDISSDLAFQSLPGTSACPATLSVTIPAGNRIDSVSTFYDMTADLVNNAWQSEQRSWLYSPATMSGEPTITNGPGLNTAGTASYSRNGLSFANTATGTVNIEMHAGRTFGGTGCGTTFNKVDDGTWTVIAYYSTIPACVEPSSQSTVSVGNDTALVSWVEAGTATQWQVEIGTAGYTVGTGSKTVVNTDTFTVFTGLNNGTAYDWYVRAICGTGPNDTSNWRGANSFTTLCPLPAVAATLPFIEDWESNNGTISGNGNIVCDPAYRWDLETTDPAGRARFGTDAVLAANGTGAVTLDRNPSGIIVANDLILTLNLASFSAATNLELLFDFAHHGEEAQPNDSVWVRGSDTDPWVGIYDLYANRGTGGVYNAVGPIDIDAALTAAGQSPSATFQLRFGQEDNFPATSPTVSDGFSFDNIVLRETPSCFAPIAAKTTVITTTTADISWNDTAATPAGSYQYSYGPAGFTAGTGTQAVTALDSVTISGLMPSTTYDWYVRSICSSTDTSLWTLSTSFTTLCVPFAAPFSESFDATTIPTCWSQSAITGGPWIFGNPGITWNTQACPTVPVDHTGNSGNFAALDFSVPDAGVVLELPDVNVSTLTTPYLQFYFTMCDAVTPPNILAVEAFNGTTWDTVSIVQQGTNGWERFGFQVSNFIYNTNLVKVRFRAEDGGGTQFQGDMGIDDVSIDEAPADEISVTAIVTPASGCGLSATETVQIAVTNNGSAAQTGFPVGYSLNGVAITPETFTASLAVGMTMNYSFTTTADLSAAGVYDLVAYTSLTGDVDNSNDTSAAVIVSATNITAFPYNESFETGNGGWLNTGTAAVWELGVPAGTIINSASDGTQAWVTDLDANYADNALSFVNSPCFDLSSVANPWINMDIWYDIETSWDGSILQSSVDGGQTWQTVGALGDFLNWYNDGTVNALNSIDPNEDGWSGNGASGSGGWLTASHALANLGGISQVNLRVAFASDGNTNNEGMAFDNISIYDRDPLYAIEVLNTEDPNGVADSIGVVAWTSGVVVGIDLDGNNGISFTIVEDSSGVQEGMNIFNFNDVSNYVVNEGDEILVHGNILQFRGLTELSPDSILVISTGNAIPTPEVVTDLDESTESKYLSIPTSYWSLSSVSGTGGSFNLDLTNGTDTITMRVDSDTDIRDSLALTPAGGINVNDTICGLFGVGGQFSSTTTAPFLDGYQIFPMRWSDITICRNLVGVNEVVSEESTFSIAPNPTNGLFVIRTSGFDNPTVQMQIRDLSGRIVYEEQINKSNTAFSKTLNLEGNAKGVYFLSIYDGENVINEKIILQ